MHQLENSLAFFDKVVEIWYKFLANVRNKADDQMEDLSETQLMEATEQLKQILEMRKKFLGVDHIATGEVGVWLGMGWGWGEEMVGEGGRVGGGGER